MDKPGAPVGLLRSCLFFSGRKRNKETVQANIAAAGEDITGGEATSVLVSASLPEDIIFDVLSRLPVRTLCRLRCVCKAWRALISDPAFAAAQGSRAAAAAPVVAGVFGKPCPLEKFYPPRAPRFPQRSLELRVIDTADGAVLKVVRDVKSIKLMRARLGLVLVGRGAHGARVIDPATGRVLELSKQLPGEYPAASYDGASIGFHTGPCHYSFGRAAPSGMYKVLRLGDVMLLNGDDIQICQVATLGNESGMAVEREPVLWRQRSEPPVLTCHCSDCVAVVDGVLHFMDRARDRGSDDPIHGRRPGPPGWNRIASFDLESEEWKMLIDGPPAGERQKGETWEMVLAELKGTLSVVQTVWSRSHPQGGYTNIWLLVDPAKSVWVKEYTIRRPRSWCYFKALDILADGRILMLNSFKKDDDVDSLDGPCILQFYNPSTGALTNLLEMGENFRGPMTLCTRSILFF
ncbi:unnamed protein product [Urochloa decumbens]|uniref:F-box domain-containing protein n=1 Tax=Urochloa decumbens TaxID=240449 RepID=A0ABC9CKX2_9POAL